MRVLVCGGRAYPDRMKVFSELDVLDHPGGQITVVITGGAAGADSHARGWAKARGREFITFEPDWSLGKRGGPLRNQRMLEEGKPDIVLVFPGGTGTRDMAHRAWLADVPIRTAA